MSKCVPQKWAPKVCKGVPNILQVEPNVFFARYSVVTVVSVPYLVQIGAVQVVSHPVQVHILHDLHNAQLCSIICYVLNNLVICEVLCAACTLCYVVKCSVVRA